MSPRVLTRIILLLLGSALTLPVSAQDKVGKAIRTETKTIQSSAQTQKKIDTLQSQTLSMIEQYRQAIWRADQLKVYNREMQKLLDAQNAEVAALRDELQGLDKSPEIEPLMLSMVATLEQFIELDLPFNIEARKGRLTLLREALAESDSIADKFRRVLEAYQVETDYGRTIDTWTGQLKFPTGETQVDFLRIGRLMLFYRTRDGVSIGYWDRDKNQWAALPATYRNTIRQGIRIAKNEAAPDLLALPVPAPEAVQ